MTPWLKSISTRAVVCPGDGASTQRTARVLGLYADRVIVITVRVIYSSAVIQLGR